MSSSNQYNVTKSNKQQHQQTTFTSQTIDMMTEESKTSSVVKRRAEIKATSTRNEK
jgi:hypothetical protein